MDFDNSKLLGLQWDCEFAVIGKNISIKSCYIDFSFFGCCCSSLLSFGNGVFGTWDKQHCVS